MLPYSYLIPPVGDDTPPIDHIIRICCALANLRPPLIRDCDNGTNTTSLDDDITIQQLIFDDD